MTLTPADSPKRTCICGTEFTPTRKTQMHCSDRCRGLTHKQKKREEIISRHIRNCNEELKANGLEEF